MCDLLMSKNISFQSLLVFFFIFHPAFGYPTIEVGEIQNDAAGKQNLPTSNVQVHYNDTSGAFNTSYITTITLDIDFVHNTTSTSIINHEPQPGEPSCACVCGIGNRKHRIVGGNITKVNEFPWIAAMFRKGKFYCGGALISRRHVLTAAHCLYGFNPKDLTVLLGEHDRETLTESESVEKKVRKATFHPSFDIYTFNNDIGVVELSSPVTFTHSVRTACLPDNPALDYTGKFGIIAGWGRVAETKPTSAKLRHTTVPIMSMDSCRTSGYMGTRITDNMICAGYEKGEMDACQGDSGGPMVVETAKGNLEIAGIVSWGRGCARPNYPGVYTKVINYLPWVQQMTASECLCQRPW